MNEKNKRLLGKAAKALILTVAVIVLAFPLYWTLLTALTDRSAVLSNTSVLPKLENLTLNNFKTIIETKPILTWFMNSIFVTVISTIISIAVSTMGAYSMSRFKYKTVSALGFFLLIVRMLPETLLVVPLYMMFVKLKLINNFASLVISNISFVIPFATWMMKGYFDAIPYALEEAAIIDGCSRLQAVRKVILPMTLPGIAATSTYSAILCWSEFLFSRTFMLKPDKWPITVGMSSLIGEYTIIWGEIMAAAVISIIPIVFVFVFLEKYIVAGTTSGAVKG